MKYEPGSLVSVRDRDWVVLPQVKSGGLMLRPLGATDAEIALIFPHVEKVEPAVFSLPDPAAAGSAASAGLLRDAVRLGLRSTTGPFRSFGHIAVEPRPYQLVPLLMAMKQEFIRLLIADDVGIGKTVEALLIARELLDRGEIERMAVICPPQLAEQWQNEMSEKFHIKAELVLPSTIAQLERGLTAEESIFEKYPFTIVSLDFIKSEQRRAEFTRSCPEFVIVDEAHACASAAGGKGHKQRYELIGELAARPERHMIFVTATPHSGREDVFRSLLAFLNPEFADLPTDLTGPQNKQARRRLAEFFVQRRRGDIRSFMDTGTPFPGRKSLELTWSANAGWLELFNKALALARDNIASETESSLWRQRVSWWSALALLRAVSSSPATAAQTLRARALGMDAPEAENPDQLDELGSHAVFDLDNSDESSLMDTLPGADAAREKSAQARYRRLAKLAESLLGKNDAKLQALVPHVQKLLAGGFAPVIFCRFIPTAEYLAAELRKALPKCEVEAVTGILPPSEREAAVLRLAANEKRVLVCTDCLSEGINLQASFNAVIHYDLSWNPTRHEQREGRVDRFGQASPEVRAITWYGRDNPMDGMVLDVLLRKHEAIRKSLGVSVPVPEDSETVMEALLNRMFLREKAQAQQGSLLLPGLKEMIEPERKRIAAEWDKAQEKEEKRSRTLFAQQTVRTEEVAQCLASADAACGSAQTVREFAESLWQLLGGVKREEKRDGQDIVSFSFEQLVRDKYAGLQLPGDNAQIVFSMPAKSGQICVGRTHPLIENLAAWLAQTTFDNLEEQTEKIVARSGVMRTRSVQKRATLLLCRFRFLIATSGAIDNLSLAEECGALAFEGSPQNAQWLPGSAIPGLLAAEPAENIASDQAAGWISKVEAGLPDLLPHIREYQEFRAEQLLKEHRDARDAARRKNLRYKVQAQGEADILGIFVYLPV